MAEFTVTTSQLRTSGSNILREGTIFQSLIAELKQGMATMRNTWEGSAAEAFYAKFTALDDNFASYHRVITEYGNFLNKAAQDYDTAENTVKGGTDNLTEGNLFA
jgi:WXG100 family type VII secretion target